MNTYAERYQSRRAQLASDAIVRGDDVAANRHIAIDFKYRLEQIEIRQRDVQEALRAIGRYSKTIIKAVKMQRNLGNRAAGGYLRNQGVPIEIAVYVLATVRLCNNWFHD